MKKRVRNCVTWEHLGLLSPLTILQTRGIFNTISSTLIGCQSGEKRAIFPAFRPIVALTGVPQIGPFLGLRAMSAILPYIRDWRRVCQVSDQRITRDHQISFAFVRVLCG
jgi:hypothetical protein